ncbi:MAG TPA: hypothetical protein VEB40_06620 [Flavipsychrobacter sp.]|nr:hypothetical protein [Flavipsychrobacter sp.]
MPAENNNPSVSLYSRLISVLHFFYIDIRRNAVIFFACVILVPACLVFLNVKKSGVYRASFTVMYEELVRKVYGDRLVKLNTLLENNRPKAQTLLGISKKAALSLESIEGTNILGEDLTKDLNVDRIPFVVNVYLNDTNYVPEIQNGVLHYLENGNSYLTDKRQLKIREIDDEIGFIDNQLKMMDSLKKKYYLAGGASTGNNTPSSEGSVYSFSYDLYKKKQELLKKKEMPMNLYVIDDAIVPTKNNKPYSIVILAGLFAGLVLYVIVAYLVLPVVRYKGV